MKFEKEHYYKLCRVNRDGLLLSFAVRGDFSHQYAVGKLTRALPGTVGLFVFKNRKGVKELDFIKMKKDSDYKLLECRVLGPVLPIKRLYTYKIDVNLDWEFDKQMSRKKRIKLIEAHMTHRQQELPMCSVLAVYPICVVS